jgi:hypothetical protein
LEGEKAHKVVGPGPRSPRLSRRLCSSTRFSPSTR